MKLSQFYFESYITFSELSNKNVANNIYDLYVAALYKELGI